VDRATNRRLPGLRTARLVLAPVLLGLLGGGAFLTRAPLIFALPLYALVVRPAEGDLGTLMKTIPTFWYAALPYLITVVILAGVVGRSTPPAADGVPYAKEGKG